MSEEEPHENCRVIICEGFDWSPFTCEAKFDLNGRGIRRFYLKGADGVWSQEALGQTWAHVTSWEYK